MRDRIVSLCLGMLASALCGADTERLPARAVPLTALDDVVVTATRTETLLRETPDVVQVITRTEIEEINPSSTGQLLEYVTGVSVETGTGSGLPDRSVVGLNGLPANYTLVLVDGVRLLSEHIHTGQNLEHIPPQLIERIEIIRGAAAAQYGSDAIGGLINIITRKCGDKRTVEGYMSGGSFDTYAGGGHMVRTGDRPAAALPIHQSGAEPWHGTPCSGPPNWQDRL